MSIKNAVKSIIPAPLWNRLSRTKAKNKLRPYYKIQEQRFIDNCSSSWNATDEEKIRAQMLYYIHRIEKGLSHTDFRSGFGKNAFLSLHAAMSKWESLGYSTNDYIYVACGSIIDAYVKKHNSLHQPIPEFISELFDASTVHNTKPLCGVHMIPAEQKNDNINLPFEKLFLNRTSIREFSADPVDISDVMAAVNVAMKTPTVCNRQAFRFTIIENPNIIADTLRLQQGWRGYTEPPLLAVITCDIRGYLAIEERNQPFIDGGLFGMSLLLALESVGIATCPLNAMFSDITDTKVRTLLHIPDYEELIMFIAIGHFPETVLAPNSFRYPADAITRMIG
jgi:nitroreductase